MATIHGVAPQQDVGVGSPFARQPSLLDNIVIVVQRLFGAVDSTPPRWAVVGRWRYHVEQVMVRCPSSLRAPVRPVRRALHIGHVGEGALLLVGVDSLSLQVSSIVVSRFPA